MFQNSCPSIPRPGYSTVNRGFSQSNRFGLTGRDREHRRIRDIRACRASQARDKDAWRDGTWRWLRPISGFSGRPKIQPKARSKAPTMLVPQLTNFPGVLPCGPMAMRCHLAYRVDAVDLKNRLRDVETDRRDAVHAALLRIVVTPAATTSMALTCRWRSRPQHEKQIRSERRDKP
jgi:hypothetical protein